MRSLKRTLRHQTASVRSNDRCRPTRVLARGPSATTGRILPHHSPIRGITSRPSSWAQPTALQARPSRPSAPSPAAASLRSLFPSSQRHSCQRSEAMRAKSPTFVTTRSSAGATLSSTTPNAPFPSISACGSRGMASTSTRYATRTIRTPTAQRGSSERLLRHSSTT